MNKAFQTWSPRTRPINYDSLQQDTGCQDTIGTDVFSVKAFNRICITEHIEGGAAIYDQPDTIGYTTGPAATGQLPPWPTRWAAWVGTTGVRVAKLPFIPLPNNVLGNPSTLYGDVKPTKVSIAFTAQGYYGLAIQKTATTIEVKWFDDGTGLVIGVESFPGFSPVAFQTAVLQHSDDGDGNDFVIYYLRPEFTRTIFARFKREGFANEYKINASLPTTPATLIAAEAVDGKLTLYGRDIFGRDIKLSTPVYNLTVDGVPDEYGNDTSLTLGFESGTYGASAVKPASPLTDSETLTLEIASGSYNDPIQEPADILDGDVNTLAIRIQSGAYE
jgi:hypothetical protein